MAHALLVGRFQPLHKGHVALIRWALERHRVTVVVGSSQHSGTPENPWTAMERVAMLRSVFGSKIHVVPVPDLGDEVRYAQHVLDHLDETPTVYIGNDPRTAELFAAKGLVWEQPGLVERERYEGTRIRDELRQTGASAALPESVARMFAERGLPAILQGN